MASEYFGLRGKLVKQYQQILNGLGADLKVNGRWNKKTEAAFNQYRDRFLEAIGAKPWPVGPNPYQLMDVEERTDEQHLDEARRAYGDMNAGEIEALERGARARQAAIESQLGALEPETERLKAQLAEHYAAQRQTLSDAALSRGLGRSSYLTDQLSGSQQRETADARAVSADASARRQALEGQMGQVGGDLAQSTARLVAERERKILSAIDEYRRLERDRADQALKYNNEQLERHLSAQEQRRQFEEQLRQQFTIARMKKRR